MHWIHSEMHNSVLQTILRKSCMSAVAHESSRMQMQMLRASHIPEPVLIMFKRHEDVIVGLVPHWEWYLSWVYLSVCLDEL